MYLDIEDGEDVLELVYRLEIYMKDVKMLLTYNVL